MNGKTSLALLEPFWTTLESCLNSGGRRLKVATNDVFPLVCTILNVKKRSQLRPMIWLWDTLVWDAQNVFWTNDVKSCIPTDLRIHPLRDAGAHLKRINYSSQQRDINSYIFSLIYVFLFFFSLSFFSDRCENTRCDFYSICETKGGKAVCVCPGGCVQVCTKHMWLVRESHVCLAGRMCPGKH